MESITGSETQRTNTPSTSAPDRMWVLVQEVRDSLLLPLLPAEIVKLRTVADLLIAVPDASLKEIGKGSHQNRHC